MRERCLKYVGIDPVKEMIPVSVEGEVITVLSESSYKVKWTLGLGYRDRVTTVTADEVHKKL